MKPPMITAASRDGVLSDGAGPRCDAAGVGRHRLPGARPVTVRAGAALFVLLLGLGALPLRGEDKGGLRLEVGGAAAFVMLMEDIEFHPSPGVNLGAAWYFTRFFGLGLWGNVVFPLQSDNDFVLVADGVVGPVVAYRDSRIAAPFFAGFFAGYGQSWGGPGGDDAALNIGVGSGLGIEFYFTPRFYIYGRVVGTYGFFGGGDLTVTPAIGVAFNFGGHGTLTPASGEPAAAQQLSPEPPVMQGFIQEPPETPVVVEAAPAEEEPGELVLRLQTRPEPFSPNGDGVDDALFMMLGVDEAPAPVVSWSVEIREPWEPYRVFKRFEGTGRPASILPWNGWGDDGTLMAAATYRVTFSAQDAEGRTAAVGATITATGVPGRVAAAPVETPAPAPVVVVEPGGPLLRFDAQPNPFSPDGDEVDDTLFMMLGVVDAPAPIASWSVEIREPWEPYRVFKRFEGNGRPPVGVSWDGLGDDGTLVMSAQVYRVTFSAVDINGKSDTVRGTAATVAQVDVLAVAEDDGYRLSASSVVFDGDRADFQGLSQELYDGNYTALRRVAELLNTRFTAFTKVRVEGHTNPVLGTVKEETETLQPLSLARARFIVEELVKLGVNRSRLEAVGMGGTHTIADPKDPENRWKNRRVEFGLSL